MSTADLFDRVARTTPDQAAAKILKNLARRRGRCLIGPDALAISAISAISRSTPEHDWRLLSRLLASSV